MRTQTVLPFDDRYEIHINHFHAARGNHVFNEPAYFCLHSGSTRDLYAQLVRSSDLKVYATLAIHESGPGTWISPRRGTFGGLSLNEPLDFPLAEQFIGILVCMLRAEGAASICIRCAPARHDLALFTVVTNTLLRQDFTIACQEMNYDLTIDERPYMERIDYGNAKRIRKALREGFVAQQVGPEACPAIHQLIEKNRARLGVAVSMSLPQLQEMVQLFPGRMHFFAVHRDASLSALVAAAVCVALTDKILYVLYWGDAADVSTYSPIALLASTIYGFCQAHGFAVMDAGISTLKGQPNAGLIQFKRNLGFTESLKLDFHLAFEAREERP